jgi:phosphopantothenoylcysteine decarboxylase/phosphopantothenate--cysteine ligase
MGFALAARAAARGADVTLIAANTALPPPSGVRIVEVGTAAELGAACATAFGDSDVLLMAAAVADFRPARPADHKLKKTDPDAPRVLELEPTEDILTGLSARRRPEQLVIGFAAEHGALAVDYGRGKLARKGLDAVVVNDISRADIGFDARDNEVVILTRDGHERAVERAPKETIADAILDEAERLRGASQEWRDGTDAQPRSGERG